MWLSHDLITDSFTTVSVTSAETLEKPHANESVASGALRFYFDVTKTCQFVISDDVWMVEIWAPLGNESVFSGKY